MPDSQQKGLGQEGTSFILKSELFFDDEEWCQRFMLLVTKILPKVAACRWLGQKRSNSEGVEPQNPINMTVVADMDDIDIWFLESNCNGWHSNGWWRSNTLPSRLRSVAMIMTRSLSICHCIPFAQHVFNTQHCCCQLKDWHHCGKTTSGSIVTFERNDVTVDTEQPSPVFAEQDWTRHVMSDWNMNRWNRRNWKKNQINGPLGSHAKDAGTKSKVSLPR